MSGKKTGKKPVAIPNVEENTIENNVQNGTKKQGIFPKQLPEQKNPIPECRIRPILPRDIILSEFGIRNPVIMDYFAEQLLVRMRDNQKGLFPVQYLATIPSRFSRGINGLTLCLYRRY